MYPTNAYVIRKATAGDSDALRRLAQLDSQAPIIGPALVGELGGTPAAAISLTDGRVISDPFRMTATLRQVLRRRYRGLTGDTCTASLADRVRAGMTPFRRRRATA